MDPAGSEPSTPLREALSCQGVLLGQHEQILSGLRSENQLLHQQIKTLCDQMAQLTSFALSTASAQLPPPREPHVADPEPFDGTLGRARGFLLQCSNVFSLRSHTYDTDKSKILYVVGLLRGRALEWAEAEDSTRPLATRSFVSFLNSFKTVFDLPDFAGNVAQRLLQITQGSDSVANYSIRFHTLAAEAGWDEGALRGIFLQGLNDQLKDELAPRDPAVDLDTLISQTIQLDNRLRERRRERRSNHCSQTSLRQPIRPTRPSSPPNLQTPTSGKLETPEPMQLGRTRLTPGERERRMRERRCLYCGELGHFLPSCPVRPKDGTHL